MSLADAASSRKERLLALRKRKAGQDDTDAPGNEWSPHYTTSSRKTQTHNNFRDEPQPVRLKQRNFDPETRTLRKRDAKDTLEDTVEKNVEGVAEQIIAEDAERRQQELVRTSPSWTMVNVAKVSVH